MNGTFDVAAAVDVAKAYDRLPLVFLVILTVFVRVAVGNLRLTTTNVNRGNLIGWALVIPYLLYAYQVGNLDYPGDGLGVILRACMGAALASYTIAVTLTVLERIAHVRVFRSILRILAWFWKWL